MMSQARWINHYRHMVFGGFENGELAIFDAQCDGSASRLIYESTDWTRSDNRLHIAEDKIYILGTRGTGSLSSVDLLDGTIRYVTDRIMDANTIALALLNNVAILHQSGEVYALFFW